MTLQLRRVRLAPGFGPGKAPTAIPPPPVANAALFCVKVASLNTETPPTSIGGESPTRLLMNKQFVASTLEAENAAIPRAALLLNTTLLRTRLVPVEYIAAPA